MTYHGENGVGILGCKNYVFSIGESDCSKYVALF